MQAVEEVEAKSDIVPDHVKALAEEAKAGEYRTRHVDIENISSSEDAIEAAYKAQFPDYQLLFDEEVQAQAQMQGEEVSEEAGSEV